MAGGMGRVWALVLFNKITAEVIIGTKTLYIWVDETVAGIINPILINILYNTFSH